MEAHGIDPRDVSWEQDEPVYRVYFWHRPPPPPGIPGDRVGYHCEEWRLTGAGEVHEVVAWAEARRRPGQTFVLYAETRDGDRVGLLRLAGVDPNAASS